MKPIGRVIFQLMTLTLVLSGGTVQAAVSPEFFSSPMGKQIQRGNAAGDECGLSAVRAVGGAYAAAYDSCAASQLDKNHQSGGDLRGFDAGFYFSAWQQMDGLARPDGPPKTPEEKQDMDASKPLAVKYLKLYREAQRKAGVTDEQVIATAGLNMDMFKDRLAAAEHGY